MKLGLEHFGVDIEKEGRGGIRLFVALPGAFRVEFCETASQRCATSFWDLKAKAVEAIVGL